MRLIGRAEGSNFRISAKPDSDAADAYDLFTAALHGIGHALGLNPGTPAFTDKLVDYKLPLTPPRSLAGEEIEFDFAGHIFGVGVGHNVMVEIATAGGTHLELGQRKLPRGDDVLSIAEVNAFTNFDVIPDVYWKSGTAGGFEDRFNWSGDSPVVPQWTAVAHFSGDALVDFNQHTRTNELVVEGGDVTFELNGNTYELRDLNSLVHDAKIAAPGKLTVANGSMPVHFDVGSGGNGSAVLNVVGQAVIRSATAGGRGTSNSIGEILIAGGSKVGFIEVFSGSSAKITDPGTRAASLFTTGGEILLTNQAIAKALSAFGVLGQVMGSQTKEGKITVSQGAIWEEVAGLEVGSEGDMEPGVLEIKDQGMVKADDFSLFEIGLGLGLKGDPGDPDAFGDGKVKITGGGVLESRTVHIGIGEFGKGIVEVDGDGSRWDADGDVLLGRGYVSPGPDGEGEVLVTPYGGLGRIEVTNKGSVAATTLVVGDAEKSHGKVHVSHPDSQLSVVEDLIVGRLGDGVVTVADEAVVSAKTILVGPEPLPPGGVATDAKIVVKDKSVFGASRVEGSYLFVGGGDSFIGREAEVSIEEGAHLQIGHKLKIWTDSRVKLGHLSDDVAVVGGEEAANVPPIVEQSGGRLSQLVITSRTGGAGGHLELAGGGVEVDRVTLRHSAGQAPPLLSGTGFVKGSIENLGGVVKPGADYIERPDDFPIDSAQDGARSQLWVHGDFIQNAGALVIDVGNENKTNAAIQHVPILITGNAQLLPSAW